MTPKAPICAPKMKGSGVTMNISFRMPLEQDQPSTASADPKRYVILLLDSFSAFDLVSVIEPLKDANRMDRTQRYTWHVLSEDGAACRASNGMEVQVEGGLDALQKRDTLIVLGGDNFQSTATLRVMAWLRRQARNGLHLGAISGAVFALAKAGVLHGSEVSTHWTYRNMLRETFNDLDVQRTIYQLGPNQFTCAGGLATLDLMLQLIRRDYDDDVATWVADNLVCSMPRTGDHEQTFSQTTRTGERNTKLARAIQIMEATLEAPISPNAIAQQINISTRQLERLFAKYLNVTPKGHYIRLRLENARLLLLQTDLKTIEVAMACGFNGASHFSKLYKKQFGLTPSQERGFGA